MSERGQATMEAVGLLPALAVAVLAIGQALAAGVARELADHAAEAGAVALLEGGDAAAAVRRALPGWAATRVAVSVVGARVVRVRLRPPGPVPAITEMLEASAQADAGEQAAS